MARLYSSELWYLNGVADGIFDSGGPADGYIWIARDISVYGIGSAVASFTQTFTFSTKALANTFWTIGQLSTQAGRSYHWEGRKVINPGDSMQFVHSFLTADVCVNGYILSTP